VKLCRFKSGDREIFGVIEGDSVFEMEGGLFEAASGGAKKGKEYKLDSVKFLAPVLPSKIVAIGLNYKAHAAEFGKPLPEEPMIFIKPSTAVIGPDDEIVYPGHMSHRVDYEGELGVVIGRTAKEVQVKDAAGYILGYTCVNDVTARDLQGKDIQYTRAKGFDTFAPIGPVIETSLDPMDAIIQTYLNGQLKQNTSSKDMIFNVFQLVSFVTHVMTLLPGDIITTGTPSGIGKMRPGDVVEVRIEGVGGLKNRVVDGQAARKLWLD
jgi:2-keto-4-pentenoate hydratase/2-oxohepta-3-ene-1,7-dioic acid hydratase in catechol pathway